MTKTRAMADLDDLLIHTPEHWRNLKTDKRDVLRAIRACIDAGCSTPEIMGTLRRGGFPYSCIPHRLRWALDPKTQPNWPGRGAER